MNEGKKSMKIIKVRYENKTKNMLTKNTTLNVILIKKQRILSCECNPQLIKVNTHWT